MPDRIAYAITRRRRLRPIPLGTMRGALQMLALGVLIGCLIALPFQPPYNGVTLLALIAAAVFIGLGYRKDPRQ